MRCCYRQTLLFSATLPAVLADFARAGLHNPVMVRLDVESKLSENLQMAFLASRAQDKAALLLYLLKEVIPPGQKTVVFAATKYVLPLWWENGEGGGMDVQCNIAAWLHLIVVQAPRRIFKCSTEVCWHICCLHISIALDSIQPFPFPLPKSFLWTCTLNVHSVVILVEHIIRVKGWYEEVVPYFVVQELLFKVAQQVC